MKIQCFGAARDLSDTDVLDINIGQGASVGLLRQTLNRQYPALAKLSSYMIAVNQAYASDTDLVSDSDEVAIIPPVSGG